MFMSVVLMFVSHILYIISEWSTSSMSTFCKGISLQSHIAIYNPVFSFELHSWCIFSSFHSYLISSYHIWHIIPHYHNLLAHTSRISWIILVLFHAAYLLRLGHGHHVKYSTISYSSCRILRTQYQFTLVYICCIWASGTFPSSRSSCSKLKSSAYISHLSIISRRHPHHIIWLVIPCLYARQSLRLLLTKLTLDIIILISTHIELFSVR